MFAILGAVVFLGEALTGGRVLGTLGIIAGIIALSWDEESRPRQWPLWIIVLPLAAAVVRGGALTLTKFGLNLWPNPYAASLIGYTMSAVVVISAMGLGAAKYAPAAGYLKTAPWFVAVGLCNGTAVLLMYSALGKGDVGLVSPIIATSPFFTLAFSAVFFNLEKITARLLAGVGLTVAGLVVLINM
jgi:drug/metabolite transporter (DMT)-like permease